MRVLRWYPLRRCSDVLQWMQMGQMVVSMLLREHVDALIDMNRAHASPVVSVATPSSRPLISCR